ncbi:MAG: type II toxin-antitoxin system VapC family toxin [Candidatus Binatia bacterium]
MWLPWGRAATRGHPYPNSQVVECTNVVWFDLVTTSYVFDEVVTYFNSRGYHAKAVEVGNRLLTSPSVQLVQVDEGLFREGWHYFEQHQDKDYSLTDCLSFVVMERFGIETAFAFDQHFVQAGFKRRP